MIWHAKEMPCHFEDGALACIIQGFDTADTRGEVRPVPSQVDLQLELRITWTANQCVSGMIEAFDDAPKEILIHGLRQSVFMVCLVMSPTGRGMHDDQFDFVDGAEMEHLRLTALHENDGITVAAHEPSPEYSPSPVVPGSGSSPSGAPAAVVIPVGLFILRSFVFGE